MTQQEKFIHAAQALDKVIQKIKDDQWDTALPSWFDHDKSEGKTLREIVCFHAYEEAWVPDMLAGKTIKEVGEDAYEGKRLLGKDPRANYTKLVKDAVAAVRKHEDIKSTVHASSGDITAAEYLKEATDYRDQRVRDITKLIGI
jgi:hypothetical protein